MAASAWGDPDRYTRLWRSTANGLEGLAALHHDAVGMAWLKHVVSQKAKLPAYLAQEIKALVYAYTMNYCTGQLQRVARHFALVGMAGKLATQYGLTGWQKGEASDAAFKCYT